MTSFALPNIDPTIKHVGVSKLRGLNASKLKEQTDDTLVIQENDTPLAVLFSYRRFLEIKQEFDSLVNTIEMLSSDTEKKSLIEAFEVLRAGRVRSLAEIEADLEKG
jgi:hypothetical protein